MKTFVRLLVAFVVVLLAATPVLAQGTTAGPTSVTLAGRGIGAGIAVGITLLGAGLGFGKIGAAALESMARQPEAADNIRGSMIVIAALLEGATFFALIVAILLSPGAGVPV